jgi:hypothetical protein
MGIPWKKLMSDTNTYVGMLSPVSGPAVLHWGNDVVNLYPVSLDIQPQWSGLLTCIASDLVRCAKIPLYCMEYNWPTTYTHRTWLRFWGSGSLVESKWCHDVIVEANNHLKLLPAFKFNITKCLSSLICCPYAYGSSFTQLYPPYLAQIMGYVVTCGVKMMSLCHGWCW